MTNRFLVWLGLAMNLLVDWIELRIAVYLVFFGSKDIYFPVFYIKEGREN